MYLTINYMIWDTQVSAVPHVLERYRQKMICDQGDGGGKMICIRNVDCIGIKIRISLEKKK
jgi:hypothetical protein